MSGNKPIAIVGANQTQFEHCKQCLQPHHCIDVPAEKGKLDQVPLLNDLKLALVYTRKTQCETLDLCSRIRRNPSMILTPMLLVADHFDVATIFIAKKAGNATVIARPFENEELAESIELLEEIIATSA